MAATASAMIVLLCRLVSLNDCILCRRYLSGSGQPVWRCAKAGPEEAGTPFARPSVVRRTVPGDEHTSVAIHGGDVTGALTSIVVPPAGVNLAAVERSLIQFALATHEGNRTHAARFLGLSRSALLYRIQKYHLR